MAGRNIKGITVEIGGDTTKLQTALKGVNSEIKNTQAQLKDVEKLLKLDPGNTDLLAQKQKLLGQAVDETKQKLETLKTAQEQANRALADGTISAEQYDALQREIAETEQKLKDLETQAEQSATALQKIAATGEKLKETGDKISGVGQKMLPVTGAVLALGTVAVKTSADFDSSMSKVAAVSGATGKDLDALRDKAREMGAKTKFSAYEAAEAMNYMAMAGWKTKDMLGGIEGIMSLAAASGEDLATTSDIVTDALTAFGLTAADSGHFADILAAASSNANTNVSMMGETFKYCAPIAGALGFSAEDTAEAIGLMANAGIKSSQAGTALRTIMNNLTGEVKICGEEIGEVSIATTNADGSMRELSYILSDCRVAFKGLTESEKAATAEGLVGKNAMSGFLALMNAGEADINKLSTAIANCDGTAEGMADTMQNNLAGQLTILKSQLEELAISFGELLMPSIRSIVAWIQKLVDWLNGMDEGTRKLIVTIALVVAAIGPVLIVVGKVISAVGTIMTIVPKLVAVIKVVKTAFAALNAVLLANPIILIIAAITALVAGFIYLWNNCEGFRQFWIELWESIKLAAVSVWNVLKSFFVSAWNAIYTTAQTVWNAVAQFFTEVWESIKACFTTVVTSISIFLSTAWTAIQATITTVFNAIYLFFTTIWTAISTFFLQIWMNIQLTFTSIVSAIYTFLYETWTSVYTSVVEIFTAVSEFFTMIWLSIQSTVTSIWTELSITVSEIAQLIFETVIAVFTEMWSGISETIYNIYCTIVDGFNEAVSFIQELASEAWTWGSDIIDNIVSGILSGIGRVASAARSVASTIRSYLHFSVPDEGPLTDFESWMPDFMSGLAKGIEKSRGLVRKAVDDVADSMVINPTVNLSAFEKVGKNAGLSELKHSGTIRVEGVNDSGSLSSVVDIIIEQLRREVRT